jgi:predicted enzyme related to lactoylglutathione lyase
MCKSAKVCEFSRIWGLYFSRLLGCRQLGACKFKEPSMPIILSQSNPVGWFELYVSDLKRARSFYRSVFQRPLEPLALPPGSDLQMCAFTMNAQTSGAAGALVQSPHMDPGPGGTLVYFSCSDCADEASRVQPHGGKLLHPKMSIGKYGFVAMVQDTEGNTIGLHSPK